MVANRKLSKREKAQYSMWQEDKLKGCVTYKWKTFPRAAWISLGIEIYYILKVHDGLTRKKRNRLENPTKIRNI